MAERSKPTERGASAAVQQYTCPAPSLRILAAMPEANLSDAFAAVVKRRRLAKGFSKAALAERAGLHQTYIGLLESGKSSGNTPSKAAIFIPPHAALEHSRRSRRTLRPESFFILFQNGTMPPR